MGLKYNTNMIKLKKFINKLFATGWCECGHRREEHHGGMCLVSYPVLNEVNGVIYEECEVDIFEGHELRDNPCRCQLFIDKGWIFKP